MEKSKQQPVKKKQETKKKLRGDITIVIAGDSGVGKTSIHRRIQGMPPEKALLVSSTVGFDYFQFKYNHPGLGEIMVDICDVAGQDEFATIRSWTYRDIDAVILVYDVTERTTFHHLESHWLPELIKRSRQPNLPILLLGNKMDLVASSLKAQTVSKSDVKKLAEKYVFTQCITASAYTWTFKTNPTPIDLFFTFIKQEYLATPRAEAKRDTRQTMVVLAESSSDEEQEDDHKTLMESTTMMPHKREEKKKKKRKEESKPQCFACISCFL
jgi:Ras-related protein Rab-1A